ncbi:prepilin peptidase [Curvibacter sp. CHRR-16]|uniref:prepilin peptidase n=1 Tax=Curvibacter sp. CHRR-16 TaxID=2835872 RepID=UPI001BDA6FE5|nr:A24 family peptidase [Curvibacter sp. CHRR-16]MBT0569395.1 prepilin peptidase [Curvibacter sp. CHRR-16]
MPLQDIPVPLWIAFWGFIGLLIGSFLNVVIHRLPRMMEEEWKAECQQFINPEAPRTSVTISLLHPRSRCPHCDHAIQWYENIPLVSYVMLRGRCSACKQPISTRYPIVELITAGLFAWCAAQHGYSAACVLWSIFAAALLSLALIDWDTTLLPDSITLPLLWLGLIGAALGWSSNSLLPHFWGAVVGYTSLWSIYWAFKLLTGKEGMGFGDFKLFAALGAWFGWQALLPIILMASIVGSVVGLILKLNASLRPGGYIPFGPFLAGGAFACLFLGPQTIMMGIGL